MNFTNVFAFVALLVTTVFAFDSVSKMGIDNLIKNIKDDTPFDPNQIEVEYEKKFFESKKLNGDDLKSIEKVKDVLDEIVKRDEWVETIFNFENAEDIDKLTEASNILKWNLKNNLKSESKLSKDDVAKYVFASDAELYLWKLSGNIKTVQDLLDIQLTSEQMKLLQAEAVKKNKEIDLDLAQTLLAKSYNEKYSESWSTLKWVGVIFAVVVVCAIIGSIIYYLTLNGEDDDEGAEKSDL